MCWIISGGGSGIGRSFVHHFSKNFKVLTCGRRLTALEETKTGASNPDQVHIVQADIADSKQRDNFVSSLPKDAQIMLLVQNAAIGDPASFENVSPDHLGIYKQLIIYILLFSAPKIFILNRQMKNNSNYIDVKIGFLF